MCQYKIETGSLFIAENFPNKLAIFNLEKLYKRNPHTQKNVRVFVIQLSQKILDYLNLNELKVTSCYGGNSDTNECSHGGVCYSTIIDGVGSDEDIY